MASFVVAALAPILPLPPTDQPPVKVIRQMYIADAASDQAAIDLVAGWDSEPAGTDYLAIPFNPKKPSGG
jgi:hypothetical protein